jgi:hypothetical protein
LLPSFIKSVCNYYYFFRNYGTIHSCKCIRSPITGYYALAIRIL